MRRRLKIFLSGALLLGLMKGGAGVGVGIAVSMILPPLIGGLSGVPLGGFGSRLPRDISISPAIPPSNILLCVSAGITVGVLADEPTGDLDSESATALTDLI